jgi:hypothetical protein
MLCVAAALHGCAYQFQGRKNPLQKIGIEKIYVVSFTNRTYRPGVEQLFTTAIIREIQKSGSFVLVNTEQAADAVLTGEVSAADATVSNTKSALKTADNRELRGASEFNAGVTCDVRLTDRTGRILFNRSESGSKVFPGAINSGDAGATNSLVNDSEQRLAIQFLASQMMASVYQRMIDIF